MKMLPLRPLLFLLCPFYLTTAFCAELPAFPLNVDHTRSTTARQLKKQVLESRILDRMESADTWKLFGPGSMTLITNRSHEGQSSIRLTSATKTDKPAAVLGRPFGESGLRREFADEDWSSFNRLSVWVYPDLPGFKVVSLLVRLRSEGTEDRSYTDGGLHHVVLKNHEWNQVAWEIDHLERKDVHAVDLIYRLQGNEPGATERVTFDFDLLELQRVEPDYFRGWPVAPGRIAYNHTGYLPDASKVALAGGRRGEAFEVVEPLGGKVRWKGKSQAVQTAEAQGMTLLDFSAFKRTGVYTLRFAGIETPPFKIGQDVLDEALMAGVNFFFAERCGYAVPGIHDVCHLDWRVRNGDKTLPIDGGWHDAGDLSQGLVNTSEALWSMLRLADKLEQSRPMIAKRLREEAAWGAKWLLKGRFGDGYRVTWATMDFWTDNKLGTVDDVTVKAANTSFDNFTAAAAEAVAARCLNKIDPALAQACRDAAEADFKFAKQQLRDPGVQVASAGAQAALELHRLAASEMYADRARAFADVILASQQLEPPRWEKPVRGFFYISPKRERPLYYNHRSHEQAPIVALVDLCEMFPRDQKARAWRDAVRAYGEYLRAGSEASAPYSMFAAGVYRVSDTSDEKQIRQIREGVRLNEGIYLRRFPVWGDFRGNLGVLLSQATAAASAARLLNWPELRDLARTQLDWTLGRNPFAQSLMYGVGHDYAPQYTAMSGDIAGSLPVGIQTRMHEDIPYWPPANCYNYAEVWVHPVSRFFLTVAELQ
jgi:hypothetical protein